MKHNVTVKTVTRHAHDLMRLIHILRCPCGYHVETQDEQIASRLKRNHQLSNADTEEANA